MLAQLPGDVAAAGLPQGIAQLVRAKTALEQLLSSARAEHEHERTRLEQALAHLRNEADTALAQHRRAEADLAAQLAAAMAASAENERSAFGGALGSATPERALIRMPLLRGRRSGSARGSFTVGASRTRLPACGRSWPLVYPRTT